MIEIHNLSKSFGNLKAVENLSLQVEDGSLLSFLGPNGAGKTTTIKMITGLMIPDSGRIILNGIDISKDPLAAKQITGYIPDAPNLYEKMTGREFLQLIGHLYRMKTGLIRSQIDFYVEKLQLMPWVNQRIEEYSRGMKQRIVFASALLHDPEILIIDEPMVGLDPNTIRTTKLLLREKASEGLTIFLSTHDLHTAGELSDRIIIIDRGRVVKAGSLSDLRQGHGSQSLEELYFDLIERAE
ncbi:MAG: ABC transporter ATP-binding protein [FCB group bacterium]|nr:ABC transporter ATP-binding protein [FCB group bacterium]